MVESGTAVILRLQSGCFTEGVAPGRSGRRGSIRNREFRRAALLTGEGKRRLYDNNSVNRSNRGTRRNRPIRACNNCKQLEERGPETIGLSRLAFFTLRQERPGLGPSARSRNARKSDRTPDDHAARQQSG